MLGKHSTTDEEHMDIKKTRRTIAKGAISLGLLLAAAQTLAQGIEDFGWRFNHTSIGIRDLAASYGSLYSGASADFGSVTSLYFYWSSNQTLLPPYSGDIAFEEANWGAVSWWGLARAWTQADVPCVDSSGNITGNCAGYVADYGLVRFNSYYSTSTDQKNNILRHEFAHVLGVGHGTCGPSNGVMAPSIGCVPLYTTLQSPEIGLLSTWY
jgi:hypothetical protein